METLGRLKTIVASLENGLELGDVPETLQWCIDTIERLQKAFDDDQEVLKGLEQERDAALAEVERLTKERVIFTARSVIVTEDEAREMFPDPDAEAKPPASD